MDHSNPTFTKISILDTGKFKQWKFRIQQYLQNEHYALWEVIEFDDSYKAPPEEIGKGPANESSTRNKGRIVAITTKDMHKRRNDVKARTTLLLALPDEHQLRFSKYETAKEVWEAILKTFGGNEATKKTKKNQLKLQYGNFKAEGSKTLEQTFNRFQAIVSHLEFMDVEIEQDDLNQKFLTSLAPEWLMYIIVWRNIDDLDTMSLDDVYNHLKVYEPEVQKKSESNSQNMAFISSSNTISEKGKVHAASVPTASTQVSTASNDVAAASLSHDTICFGRRLDWSYMANEEENHALVADDEVLTEFALMAKSSSNSENEKDLSWTGLPEFVDDTVTDYHRPTPSSIMSKPMIKFVKEADCPRVIKINNTENAKKSTVKYAEMYRNISKGPKVRGNQQNWNNLKSQQLGKDFLMQNKACFKCGYFDHLASNCGVWMDNGKTWPKNKYTHKSNPHNNIDDKGYWDSGCSRNMTGNISYLSEYEPYDGGYVSFGHGGGKITSKGIIKTSKLEFNNVYFMKELKTPRQHNMYSIDLNNIVPHKNLTCLVAKASVDEELRMRLVAFLGIITEVENLKDHKVKIIRCDNGGEFKNQEMNEFCTKKGIRREFSNARTPQQNGVAERRNRTLIEAARTMVLVNKSQNKTLYELFSSRIPAIGDEGYFVGYSLSSKAFRVFNKRTKKVEENLHVDFLENKLIEKGVGPNWLFDIDTLTNSMNYVPAVVAGTSSTNISAHMETSNDTIKNSDAHDNSQKEQDCNADVPESSGISNPTATSKVPSTDQVEPAVSLTVESEILTAPSLGNALTNRLEDTFGDTTNAVTLNEMEADLSNMETSIPVSPTPTFRIHEDHPKSQIIGPVDTPVQTRHKSKDMEEQSFIATIHQKTNPKLLQFCLFSCFLSQEEPKKIFDAHKDPNHLGKFDAKGYEGYFVGYSLSSKAFRVFNKRTKKVEKNLHVDFLENKLIEKGAGPNWLFELTFQPPGFQDPEFPERVYKVEKAMYGLHQAHRAWYVLQKKDGIFFLQDKYVGDILKKFGYSDVRSMIGSLMYLTASRLDIMFAFCACARHQLTPKECHLHDVKRIFRYLKGHPNLGLWYPKESLFDLVAYSDSDYGGAIQDRKSTTGGCQFMGRRLISWQCKKQTIMATYTTRQNMWQLLVAVDKFFGYKIKCWIMDSEQRTHEFMHVYLGFASVYVWIRTVPLFASMIVTQGEGLANPTEPHHTPSPQEHHLPQHDSPPLSHQPIIPEPISHDLQAPIETLTPRRLTKRAIRIAQSKALSSDADEPASISRDDRQGEAFPTVSSLDAGQDRENIAKTSAMPHESSPRVPSLDADEGRGIIDIGEELGADKSTEKKSNDIEEMVNVLSSMEAANILSSRGAAASVSPADVFSTSGVPTVSGSFPTVSAIFTTASVVTPYTRRSRGITTGSLQPMRIPIISAKNKGKEKVTEIEVPKKKKLQVQIDAQVAREMEEEFARENQRLSEQVERDSEIARIHAEEEVKLMIEGHDRSNEVIAKNLSEYEQAEANLSVGEKIELISELDKDQDHRAKILKYQAQQSKPLSKKEQREFYMSVLKRHVGWKTKHFRGMTLERIKEKFIPVWKEWEDFVPMSSKEESERVKRPGIKLDQGSSKKSTRDKEKELWVELKRLFEPVFKDQLWTYDQAFMHDPLDWKLYDTCGVHHVSTKNQEIFMLVEKDYPLRKGLATVMINEELFEASSPGLKLAGGPWFVVEKDVKDNVVFVSRNYYSVDKRRLSFWVGSFRWISGSLLHNFNQLRCKLSDVGRQYLEAEYDDYNATNANGAAFFRALIAMAMVMIQTSEASDLRVGAFSTYDAYIMYLLHGYWILRDCRKKLFVVYGGSIITNDSNLMCCFTVRPTVVRFCGVYGNVMRRAYGSGAGDEDYFNRHC
uniref:Integrase catalytic domain-containing protein n=1 Tax=Tanacetum cinerariifolium TaxID=118510 RepID=A0A6L2JZG8_TANCI|nr:hypothetical protein [Tanacetum cinerariifolium]